MPLFPSTQIIQMNSTTNSASVTGQVWWDGTNLRMNIGGTVFYLTHVPVGSQFTISGVSANFTYNASTASTSQTAQALGTLIQALQTSNL